MKKLAIATLMCGLLLSQCSYAKETKQQTFINVSDALVTDYQSGDSMYISVLTDDKSYKDIYCGMDECFDWEENFEPFIVQNARIKRVWNKKSKKYALYLNSITR